MSKTDYLHIILNPVAGNGNAVEAWDKIKNFLLENNLKYELLKTESGQDAYELALNFGNSFKGISKSKNTKLVIIGGDGTLNACLNGIKKSAHPDIPIGFIPAGSGNDFAKAANFETNPLKNIQNIINMENCSSLTIGKCLDRDNHDDVKYFVNNIGFGFDANVVFHTNNSNIKDFLNKLKLGSLSYVANVFDVLAKQKGFPIEASDNNSNHKISESNAYIVTATNHPYFGGGVKIMPNASVKDNQIHLIVTKKMSLSRLIYFFSKVFTSGKHTELSDVNTLESTDFNLQVNSAQHCQMDGEIYERESYSVNISADRQNFWIL